MSKNGKTDRRRRKGPAYTTAILFAAESLATSSAVKIGHQRPKLQAAFRVLITKHPGAVPKLPKFYCAVIANILVFVACATPKVAKAAFEWIYSIFSMILVPCSTLQMRWREISQQSFLGVRAGTARHSSG
jgi:hypothetical protein